ncbi:alpha/beta hydrolase family protein [Lacimicrobium alkaliphilum]|uniref:Peptidase S9 prolyl oligopeptidase catalytic domain-containing protein n=2 Tax=Lacimicrobium alkaliphilum TaxID=1526571 RepID=A0ABQ1RLK7_9ALTE|nr:hypothetical protein GCM10011357_27520 [Lacimicrobium alkaliphilum]
MHSRDDEKVDVMHSLQLAKELTRQNRTFRMKIFEDGGHSLSGHRDEARAELIEWFSRYIK